MNIYDIAKEANVSIATVSRVLNNKPNVSDESRKKVLRVLSNSDYKPSALARGLVHNTSNYVSVIIEDIRHSHYISIAYYLEQSIKELGYDCTISNCKAAEIGTLLSSISVQRPRGIVIIGSVFSNSLTEQAISEHVSNFPVIMINGNLHCVNVTSIFPDDRGGIALAVDYLCEKGYRDIFFVKDNTTWSSENKYEGYQAAMAANGLGKEACVLTTTNSLEGGTAVAQEFLKEHYKPGCRKALVCSEDVTASGCLQELLRHGVKVPEEVAIIGYDNSDICKFSTPNITSIDSRPDVVGSEAAWILGRMSSDSTPNIRHVVVSPVLIERETV